MSSYVLVFRHAEAEPKGLKPDSVRELTSRGVQDAQKVSRIIAKYLKKQNVQIDVIYTSPYNRALETARILKKNIVSAKFVLTKELTPEVKVARTFSKLVKANASIAVVGHEPHLSHFMSYMLTAGTHLKFDIKKAGFALFELDSAFAKKGKFKNNTQQNGAILRCLVQPSNLKDLKSK
ncbi:MAG: phosphohistidine phosphatase SixA [Bdellovibrionales bacterium]